MLISGNKMEYFPTPKQNSEKRGHWRVTDKLFSNEKKKKTIPCQNFMKLHREIENTTNSVNISPNIEKKAFL